MHAMRARVREQETRPAACELYTTPGVLVYMSPCLMHVDTRRRGQQPELTPLPIAERFCGQRVASQCSLYVPS